MFSLPTHNDKKADLSCAFVCIGSGMRVTGVFAVLTFMSKEASLVFNHMKIDFMKLNWSTRSGVRDGEKEERGGICPGLNGLNVCGKEFLMEN